MIAEKGGVGFPGSSLLKQSYVAQREVGPTLRYSRYAASRYEIISPIWIAILAGIAGQVIGCPAAGANHIDLQIPFPVR